MLLLLGRSGSGGTATGRAPVCQVRLYDTTGKCVGVVVDYGELQVEQERFGGQTLAISVRKDSRLVSLALGTAVGQECYGYSLGVYHRGQRLFLGPVREVGLKARPAYMDLTLEGHMQHALRRRQNWTSTGANGADTGRPNALAIQYIDRAMGGITGPVYPSGYPGGGAGPLRTDYRYFTYTAGVAVGLPTSITYEVQAGNNLQGVIEELCLRYDMCPVYTKLGALAGRIDVEYPYQRADLSSTICLTRLRGSVSSWEEAIPYGLTTVGRVAGAGSGATQVQSFATSGTATYGVYEDQATTPEATLTAAVNDTSLLTRAAAPLITYKIGVTDTANARFALDYGWRNTVAIYDPDWGRATEQLIVGFTYNASNGGRAWNAELTIQEPPASMLRHMAGKTGIPFGRSSGDRWRDNRG